MQRQLISSISSAPMIRDPAATPWCSWLRPWRSNPVQVVTCWMLVTGFSSWFSDDEGWFRRVDQVGPSIIIQSYAIWLNQNREFSVSISKTFKLIQNSLFWNNKGRGQNKIEGKWKALGQKSMKERGWINRTRKWVITSELTSWSLTHFFFNESLNLLPEFSSASRDITTFWVFLLLVCF